MKTITLSLILLFCSLLSVAQEFTVHEWGTFTTLYSSEGVQLNGLEIEEEVLPNFVYNLVQPVPEVVLDSRNCILEGSNDITDFGYGFKASDSELCAVKGFSLPLSNVNVKMETPVIYFYSDNAIENIKVAVDFKGGSISQWYPQKEAGETRLGIVEALRDSALIDPNHTLPLDFSLPYVGNILWNIDVLHSQDKPDLLIDVPGNPINYGINNTWLAPRATNANIVKNKEGEVEKYLFYRGLAHFDPQLALSIKRANDLQIENKHDEKIDFVMVYDTRHSIDEPNVWFSSLDALETKSVSLDNDAKFINSPQEAHQKLQEALVEAGLFEDEAAAMIKTWDHSYFKSNGCKVFWICPENFVDELLPINIQPQPAHINRVFVGRSEIVTPAEEEEILSLNKTDFNNRYKDHKFGYAYRELRDIKEAQITNINEISAVGGFTLYPNPTNGTLKLASQEVIQSINIHNLQGKKVFSQQNVNQHQISFSIEFLAAGTYMIEIQTANNLFTQKFLAQQ